MTVKHDTDALGHIVNIAAVVIHSTNNVKDHNF